MTPSPSSARAPRGLLPVLALLVTVVISVTALATAKGRWAVALGDTDDAMRLVMVRDLASGRAGWFDVHVDRLQPPLGVDMHWSRLIDGALVALQSLFGLFVPHAQAETLMRVVWPLLWIFPAAWAVMVIARRLGAVNADFLGAVVLMVDILMFSQWWPGRIDHHDVQITLALIALAGAAAGGTGGAILAGVMTGLDVAVGLEALAFLAVIGAMIALRFAFDGRTVRQARAYGLSLALSSAGFYLVQTAPSRWGRAVCDAVGINLVVALLIAGVGLALAAGLAARRGALARWGALALTGVAAAGAYALINPACLHGPMGEVDPRIAPIWMSLINEMQPLVKNLGEINNSMAVSALVSMGLGVLAWIFIGLRAERRTFGWVITGAVMLASAVLALKARRMAFYVGWFSVPLIAAAASLMAARFRRWQLLIGAALAVAFSPSSVTAGVTFLRKLHPPSVAQARKAATEAKRQKLSSACSTNAAYRQLAALPPGRVLGEIDLGPFVLALTPHSAIAAPYHRMGWGILAANDALAAKPGPDEAAVRRLGVSYVLDCPARAYQMNHAGLGPQSLQVRLDENRPPAWLEPLSPPSAPIRVYRVKPLA